jgi:hypothetical protein
VSLSTRIAGYDWAAVASALDELGHALLPELLDAAQCKELIALYEEDAHFRSTIEMAHHAYGNGRYRYLAYPLPELVEVLRRDLYDRLLPIGRSWYERLAIEGALPNSLAELLASCHAAGQQRPTPLVLRYVEDGYNRMHQDVYGDIAFPLQVAVLLSPPDDFEGGDFLVSENRARMQVRTESIPLTQGEGIVIANTIRPVPSPRGFARAQMRHGMSRLRGGKRYALGIIFHDAE